MISKLLQHHYSAAIAVKMPEWNMKNQEVVMIERPRIELSWRTACDRFDKGKLYAQYLSFMDVDCVFKIPKTQDNNANGRKKSIHRSQSDKRSHTSCTPVNSPKMLHPVVSFQKSQSKLRSNNNPLF